MKSIPIPSNWPKVDHEAKGEISKASYPVEEFHFDDIDIVELKAAWKFEPSPQPLPHDAECDCPSCKVRRNP